MEIEVKKATQIFFPNASFEMIYLEAFANALDAGADEFKIDINVNGTNPDDLNSLTIKLWDNGVGFDDTRFNKFSKLLSVEDKAHKGLGRLVYLCYFDKVKIESNYSGKKHRSFIFHENFKKESKVSESDDNQTWSELTMQGFNGQRLKRNENISVGFIKRILLEHFYIKFYNAKNNGKEIKVSIKSTIGEKEDSETISGDDLPQFNSFVVDNTTTDLFDSIVVYYNITKIQDLSRKPIFITALSIDDRSMQIDIIADENKSSSYNMIFILKSESLQGTTDESRQNIRIDLTH